MHFVLLSNYNNYYNRIYKKLDTYQEYIAEADGNVQVLDKSVNFDLQDGVMTQHVFNCTFDGEPNYCLLLNETDNSIASRWFVIEWDKVRGNQYRAILRRDLLADHYDAITASPCFIEKGWVPNTDPAVFNKENITVNQIKKKEWMIKDDTDIAWLIGYLATDHQDLSGSFAIDPEVDVKYTGNFSDWTYANLCNGSEYTTINSDSAYNNMRFLLHYIAQLSGTSYEFMFNGQSGTAYENNTPRDYWWTSKAACDDYRNSDWYSTINWNTCMSKVLQDHTGWTSITDANAVLSLVGKKLKFDDGVYELTLTQNRDEMQSDWSYWNNGYLYDYIYGIVDANLSGGIQGVNYYPVAYKLYLKKFRITAQKVVTEGTYTYSITHSAKKVNDAPYKMIAIPYNTATVPYYMDGITLNKELAIAWAMDIAKSMGSGCYDFQILPFMPKIGLPFEIDIGMQIGVGVVSYTWHWDSSATPTEGEDFIYLKTGDTKKCIAFMCSASNWEFQTFMYNGELSTSGPAISNFKESNELDMYRVCSPNYASVFEFSPSKNGGNYGRYNVYCTYKPYQPFIYIAPKYDSLYGEDFKDNRGLILSGDFSLPIISDAWINYQLQNKNYQLAFDRQIENMEAQYDWQRKLSISQAITGTVQGTASGAMTGALVGGGWGALIGGAIGAGAGVAGGVMDVEMNKALHNEAIDFAKDNFGYQLENIKALPNTLNKVSSLVATSKIFPFVEYYTCTDEEREAFRNKIKYNGMSIGRIGHILDFKNPSDQTYIKGQIIRLEGKFDTHTANEIANEFNKGWYI